MTAVELLESINPLDEHERVEAKRASEAGKSVHETVCAVANQPGLGDSWIALGLAQFRDMHLSDEEAKALIVVREAGAIDNATYRELNKVDALVASGTLHRLCYAGLLAQKGRGPATYYIATERQHAGGKGLPTKSVVLSTDPEGLLTNPEALSDKAEDLPTNPIPEEEIVRPLMRDRRLVMTNPAGLNDPQQAYWAQEANNE